jgi:acid phosphatase
VIVVEENEGNSSVIGSSSMPYLNALADRYGLAVNYYANTHPSIGNYFWLTTGQQITNDSNFVGPVSVDNIVRQLNVAFIRREPSADWLHRWRFGSLCEAT